MTWAVGGLPEPPSSRGCFSLTQAPFLVSNPPVKFFPVALAACLLSALTTAAGSPSAHIQVFFSPQGGCTEAVVGALKQARQTVLVQAYSFTSAPIAKALLEAHRRGVEVHVILDKSQRTEKYSSATFLFNEGVPVAIDDQHPIAHNKVIVIDGARVITGSFNFTTAAEKHNAENLLVIDDAELAAKYTANWKNHERHAVAYSR